jgi:hypothetical protein
VIFLLTDDLFRVGDETVHSLLTLFRVAFEGRHSVQVDVGANYTAWLGHRGDA